MLSNCFCYLSNNGKFFPISINLILNHFWKKKNQIGNFPASSFLLPVPLSQPD